MSSKAVERRVAKDLQPQFTRSSPSGPHFSFPKNVRLRKKNEFSVVMQEGRKCVGSHVVVLARQNSTQSRLGVVASRKLGPANKRNRVKRRIREIFRKEVGTASCRNQHWDIVVIIRKRATIASFDEISKCLLNCLAKIKR